ncbi:hypothetical protein GCM10008959_37330 [Deinococcus seoulensis]|uniref:Uncharacterized protein n=1 Tax=Deinococcus seoulensis TaxID=1837379 RepID=A0ABQ2RZJ3_9DEIO|nr:hypothetical protein [Deinococcus seoulensis]GGR72345.1 hypothetical protein GCM10008959_37330 [Deinococcus seoulensis]
MKALRVAALSAALLVSASAQETGKAELDRSSVTPGAERLLQQVQEAVTTAGGDLDRSQVNWVIAFSTGHYKADPLGAQAARELATQFVQKVAVQGDQVTARAWEMDTWEYRNPAGLTQVIGNDAQADLERTANLWPTTPAVGSVGGHDTERAAVTLTREFSDAPGTVLILLTNTAASVGAAGIRVMGTNAPEYQELLGNWTRVSGTQDGATLNLPYVVSTPSRQIQGQMQAVVFVPRTFTSAPLAGGTRTEQRTNAPKQTGTDGGKGGPNPAGLLVALLVLGGAGFAVWKLIGGGGAGGGRGSVRVGDSSFSVRDMPAGRPFCVIAGAGYAAEDDMPVVPVAGLPPVPVAQITRIGKDYRVRGVHDDIRLSSVGGRVVAGDSATVTLRPETPDAPLEFTGEVRGPGGVPKEITRSVVMSLDGEN